MKTRTFLRCLDVVFATVALAYVVMAGYVLWAILGTR